jgi:hypothetical protein
MTAVVAAVAGGGLLLSCRLWAVCVDRTTTLLRLIDSTAFRSDLGAQEY